jgi:hypothetical protein
MAKKNVQIKLPEIIKRYWKSELMGTITSLSGYKIAYLITNDDLHSAYWASMSENVGFYGSRFIEEYYNTKSAMKSIENIASEHIGPELADNFLIRPFMQYAGGSNFKEVGIILGKFSTDCVFYAWSYLNYKKKNGTNS